MDKMPALPLGTKKRGREKEKERECHEFDGMGREEQREHVPVGNMFEIHLKSTWELKAKMHLFEIHLGGAGFFVKRGVYGHDSAKWAGESNGNMLGNPVASNAKKRLFETHSGGRRLGSGIRQSGPARATGRRSATPLR